MKASDEASFGSMEETEEPKKLFHHLTHRWHEHVLRQPNALAVGDVGGQAYSWVQLHDEVQSKILQLKALNLPARARVVLAGPRSKTFVAWLWACWELDFTVVLLQPTPPERYRALLEQSQAHAVWDGSLAVRTALAPPQANDAAYIIYTSGSTGKPKGVEVGPKGLPLVWQEQARCFMMTPQSRSAWMLSPAFDASLSDIGVALHAGACLWVVPEGRWRRYRSWCADMDAHGITHLDAPPSWLNAFHRFSPPQSLQVIIAGGEPTPPAILKAWADQVRWINVYGPTEATICTSAEVRTSHTLEPTLGQPFTHVLYALKDAQGHLHLTPQSSQEGELWIGGHAVALGYTDPRLTQERFVEYDQTRWFKTGDWVRFENGKWLYLGRMDRQIKRHGVLVNLSEIEQCLLSHEKVLDAYVEEQNEVLVAYVRVEDWNEEQASHTLKKWLEPKLNPQARVQRYVCVSSWPTQNGKVNKEALRAMVV